MNIRSLPQNNSQASPARRDRVDALATLPVFYKLAGKNVLIAGGSEAASWKAELLAASGAHVNVYAEELDPDFKTLIETPRTTGTFTWHQRPWGSDCFAAMQIAICDAKTEGEAKAFYCAARHAGAAVNVIDKPAYCDFQFGSIVNRSPVVIAISTDGAAPILGQAIRRRIETLIAPSLTLWADLAKNVRQTIHERLEPGKRRRTFWEEFVDRAFRRDPGKDETNQLIAMASKLATTHLTAKVTLVGAGPGDAELLTLKAVRALQAADVILFDDLVSDDVLELARREAKRMLVAKTSGRKSAQQEDIKELMIALAKSGKHVVRLKSGDPMVFESTSEEIAWLQNKDIEVQVVPGIACNKTTPLQIVEVSTDQNQRQAAR